MKTLSIIIVAYKAKDYLDTCLASLPRHKQWETIVIDNTLHNQGFSKACNQGAHLAQGTYLLFLNPDTVVEPGAIETLVEEIKKDKTIGIIGPQLQDELGKPYISATQQPTRLSAFVVYSILNAWFKRNTISRDYWYNYQIPRTQKAVGSVSGAALMIAKKDFEKLGGFDERLFMYWEDFDLCRLMKVAGKRVVYEPRAQIIHARAKSTERDSARTRSIFRTSRYLFFKKHYGRLYAVVLETWLTLVEEWRLWALLAIAIYVRFDRLWQLMPLIPDQARDFMAAITALKTRTVPLLGIPSSLPQFHQGPLYIWWLMGLFSLWGPSAVAAGYAAAMTGTVTVFLAYRVAEAWWNRRVAFMTGLVLATAPLAVVQARLAFMTNPIPLASLWFLWRLNKPLQSARDWCWLTLSFALLFQFELAAFPLILLLVMKGLKNRRSWPRGLQGIIAGIIIGLWPQLAYDLTHGFRQMGLFIGWVGYRLVRFWGVIPGKQSGWGQLGNAIVNIVTYLTRFAGWDKPGFTLIVSVIVVAGGIHLVRGWRMHERISYSYLAIFILLLAYLIHGAPSEAYFPVLFVPIAWAVGWTIDQLVPASVCQWAMALILLMCLVNAHYLITHDYLVYSADNLAKGLQLPYGAPLQSQEQIVDELVHLTGHRPLHLQAIGPGTEFPSYLDNYRFLLKARGVVTTDSGVPVWFLSGQSGLDIEIPNAHVFRLNGITVAVGL